MAKSGCFQVYFGVSALFWGYLSAHSERFCGHGLLEFSRDLLCLISDKFAGYDFPAVLVYALEDYCHGVSTA